MARQDEAIALGAEMDQKLALRLHGTGDTLRTRVVGGANSTHGAEAAT